MGDYHHKWRKDWNTNRTLPEQLLDFIHGKAAMIAME